MLTHSNLPVPVIALATAVAVLWGIGSPARNSAVNSEQVAQINATHLGGSDARTEAFHLALVFALVTPNV